MWHTYSLLYYLFCLHLHCMGWILFCNRVSHRGAWVFLRGELKGRFSSVQFSLFHLFKIQQRLFFPILLCLCWLFFWWALNINCEIPSSTKSTIVTDKILDLLDHCSSVFFVINEDVFCHSPVSQRSRQYLLCRSNESSLVSTHRRALNGSVLTGF